MWVAADQLFADPRCHVCQIKPPFLARDLGMEHHLQQQIAQLFGQVCVVSVADRIGYFVSFLEHIGHQGGVGLLQIPRAAGLRVAQLGDHCDQLAQGSGGIGRGGHGLVLTRWRHPRIATRAAG